MTVYLVYSIYSYMASLASCKIEKIYKEQNDNQKIRIFFVLKHAFRVTGTVLLITHFLS